LHIAERLEYAEHLARNGIKDVPVDFDYPAELELSGRMEELRRIVRREEDSDGSHGAPSESSEGTMIFTRSQLKGSPVPLPANAEPGPMIEAVFDERKGPSKKVIFSVIAVLSIIVGAAITVAFNVQKKKYEQVVSAQNTEPEKDSRGPLSNLLAETSGKIKAAPPKLPEPAAPEFPELKVQAIMYNGAKSSVVINGRSCRLGDEIEGVRLVAVQQNDVTIEKQGQQRKLTLTLR
jgi:hypothetical protein